MCHTVFKALVRRHVAVLSSAVYKDGVDWEMESLLSELLSNWLIIAQMSSENSEYVYSTKTQMTEFQDNSIHIDVN